MKCKICKRKFQLNKGQVYQVYEPKTMVQSFTETAKMFDVIDCPHCGCQHLLGERLPKVKNLLGGDEND